MCSKNVFISIITSLCFTFQTYANDPKLQKIDDQLLELATSGINQLEYIVLMSDQATIRDLKGLNKIQKGRAVYQTLKNFAVKSQKDIINTLKSERITHKSYFVVNAILVQSAPEIMFQLAGRPDVQSIIYNPWVKMEVPELERSDLLARGSDPEWGILKIKADSVWQLGFRGQGVVVGGQDTGYEWDVSPLRDKYRGFGGGSADHNFNWHDAIREPNPRFPAENLNPCGLGLLFPCDDNNHGTHTMGTMVGEDENNAIGVAPASRWIACRNMDRGWGKPSTYLECFEWFLAPTDLQGENADPDKSPHVINNSWACPEDEGCNPSNWNIMELVVNNLRASGVMVVVSAGNSGSRGCGSIDTPAPMFEGSFTVGSTRQNDTISGFSSRGPVIVDDSYRLKPDVVAPGQGVRSVVRGGNFASYSGTSMAGPHVAGLVALLISANPALAGEVDVLSNIIRSSAVPLTIDQDCFDFAGNEIPNATYGYGRVDAMAALKLALEFIPSSANDIQKGQLSVFPNPFGAFIEFRMTDPVLNRKIDVVEIMDITGKVLIKVNNESDAETININTIAFSTGVYLYMVRIGNTLLTGKVVKM